LCNDLDDDCDLAVDEDIAWQTWYPDADGDLFGDETDAGEPACAPPHVGAVLDHTDCNDGLPAVNPLATEVCNDIDDDCDGATDGPDAEGAAELYPDGDRDGFGRKGSTAEPMCPTDGFADNDLDCNDGDSGINPDATEIPGDKVDQDCNPDNDTIDNDNDGYISEAAGGDDCNDDDAGINPGEDELPYNRIDEDCNGSDLTDADGDGYFASRSGGDDCDDDNSSIHPGVERDQCGDNIDEDCSGGDLCSGCGSDKNGGTGCSNDPGNSLRPRALLVIEAVLLALVVVRRRRAYAGARLTP
jgi:hypothetical protein